MKIDQLDNSIAAVETLVCKAGHTLVKVRGDVLEKFNGDYCKADGYKCCILTPDVRVSRGFKTRDMAPKY